MILRIVIAALGLASCVWLIIATVEQLIANIKTIGDDEDE